jgi:benzoyl-CoA-dihydrodiol lyase
VAEGVRGKRALDWRLVDEIAPRSRFVAAVRERADALASRAAQRSGPGIVLEPLDPQRDGDRISYRHVTLSIDRARRVAELSLRGPSAAGGLSSGALREAGGDFWALRAFRELDAALLELRFNYLDVGLIVLKTEGDPEAVLASDRFLAEASQNDWLAREVVLLMRRTLKRLDLTARTAFAIVEPGSCFVGSLFELALAADRSYMLDAEPAARVGFSPLSFGSLPMGNGLSRLETRFLSDPGQVEKLKSAAGLLGPAAALEAGLVTFTPDDIDWEDEVRIAIEERAAFSPDALTAMEANLRFAGPETLETKIFGRLSAWQNWVFQRPNAVGEKGALKVYGSPERPVFDYNRT